MIGFLTPKVSAWAIGIVFALLCAQTARLSWATADLATVKANLTVCTSDNKSLTERIDAQNAAISGLEEQARKGDAKARAIALEALKKRQKQREDAARVHGAGAEVMNSWFANTFSR